MPAARQLPTTYLALAWLCLAPSLYICQRRDQTYILIRPKTLLLSQENPEGTVQIVCRQLPLSSDVSGRQLVLRRTPVQRSPGQSSETVADMTGSNIRVPDSLNKASGDVNRELVVTLTAASCRESIYVYTCRAVLSNRDNNTASTTFTVATPSPQISIRADPSKSIYGQDEALSLTCSSGDDVIGIINSVEGRGRWVWQHNDVGKWQPVSRSDVSGGTVEPSGDCFQKASPTSLEVRVLDLEKCSRRFRCYIKYGDDRAVDNAKEFLVSAGFSCNEGTQILGTNPFVAIISVLATVAVFCMMAYGLFQLSRHKRSQQIGERERQMGMRILSPMTPEQRDRLLKEKVEKQTTETPPTPPPPPESQPLLTLTQSLPALGVKPAEEKQQEEKEEKKEEEKEKEKEVGESDVDKVEEKKHQKNVTVIVETGEDSVAGWEESVEGIEEIVDETSEYHTEEGVSTDVSSADLSEA